MKNNIKQEIAIPQFVKFSNEDMSPTNSFNKGKKLVNWGNKNDYPNFLLDLYDEKGGSRHSMIIKKKTRFIAGQGLEEILDPNTLSFIENNNLEDQLLKAAFDYEIFNGFSFEIIWSKDGQSIVSVKHIPFSQLRIGIVDDSLVNYYWYCKDWTQTRKYEPEAILAYNPDMPVGKQILRYTEYNPKNILFDYPTPEYQSALYAIKTDYELSKYDYFNVKNGFLPAAMLTFRNGIPDSDKQDEIVDGINAEYSGVENNNKLMINFIDPAEQHLAPEITTFTLNDSDKKFEVMIKRIENAIIQGSGIPPQLLILTEGQLGGTQDRPELMDEFHKDYVAPRQKNIERVINKVMKVNNLQNIELKKYGN